jgi:hypothetical protein
LSCHGMVDVFSATSCDEFCCLNLDGLVVVTRRGQIAWWLRDHGKIGSLEYEYEPAGKEYNGLEMNEEHLN